MGVYHQASIMILVLVGLVLRSVSDLKPCIGNNLPICPYWAPNLGSRALTLGLEPLS